MKAIDIECSECRGTGVFRVRTAPKGLGIICGECNGTGKKTFEYKPFTSRRRRKDIDQVTKVSANLGGLGFGPLSGPRISYSEFLSGKMPEDAIKIVK